MPLVDEICRLTFVARFSRPAGLFGGGVAASVDFERRESGKATNEATGEEAVR